MTSRIQLHPEETQLIRAILAKKIPSLRVHAFGSRVSGRAKPMSDLDLLVIDDPPLSASDRHQLAEAFTESLLRFKVDLIYQSEVTNRFLDLIEQTSVPFIPPEDHQAKENVAG